jgi:hypothetical protein
MSLTVVNNLVTKEKYREFTAVETRNKFSHKEIIITHAKSFSGRYSISKMITKKLI